MKKKHKLLLIIFISIVIAYLIYIFNNSSKITITSFGDGVAIGMLTEDKQSLSFNDYLKDYYEDLNMLKSFNKDYSSKNNSINDLLNEYSEITKNNIKQVINNSSLITIAIGEDELTKKAITNDLNAQSIKAYLKSYEEFLKGIRNITNVDTIIVGLYENKYLNKSNIIILNSELNNLAAKYKCIFIDTDKYVSEENFFNKDTYYINFKAHKLITKSIIDLL